MPVYYKFYYVGPTNWYVTNEVIQYSFIILLKCHLIVISICKLFIVKFVISLAFSPTKKKKKKKYNTITIKCMKNAKANTNFKKKNLQIEVRGIWSVLLK